MSEWEVPTLNLVKSGFAKSGVVQKTVELSIYRVAARIGLVAARAEVENAVARRAEVEAAEEMTERMRDADAERSRAEAQVEGFLAYDESPLTGDAETLSHGDDECLPGCREEPMMPMPMMTIRSEQETQTLRTAGLESARRQVALLREAEALRLQNYSLARKIDTMEKRIEQAEAEIAEFHESPEAVIDRFTSSRFRDKATRSKASASLRGQINDESDPRAKLSMLWGLLEWVNLVGERCANRRRYSENMHKLAFVLNGLSPVAYRVLRCYLPLPCPSTIHNVFGDAMIETQLILMETDNLDEFLATWRRQHGIREDEAVDVVLAFDATSCRATGLLKTPSRNEGIMVFMMLPLDPRFPGTVLHVRPTASMKVDLETKTEEEVIRAKLAASRFNVKAVATDADPGTNQRHREFFEQYKNLIREASILEIVNILRMQDPGCVFIGMPVTDALHLFKAVRRRLEDHGLTERKSLHGPGGFLVMPDARKLLYELVPSAENRTKHTSFQDGPAIQLCQLSVVLAALGREQEGLGHFLAPWAFIEAAFREEHLSRELRCVYLQLAFSMLAVAYSETERDVPEGVRFYTSQQCIRGMNLCVVLFILLTTNVGPMNLGRISSHNLEMHFGLTRAALRGDDHLERWMCAEARAVLIAGFITDLELQSFRRRTRASLAGVSICAAADENSTTHRAADLSLGEARAEAVRWMLGEASFDRDGADPLEAWLTKIDEELDDYDDRKLMTPGAADYLGSQHVFRAFGLRHRKEVSAPANIDVMVELAARANAEAEERAAELELAGDT
jgi:hypothetical protein